MPQHLLDDQSLLEFVSGSNAHTAPITFSRDLRKNLLSFVDPAVFAGAKALSSLDLSENQITLLATNTLPANLSFLFEPSLGISVDGSNACV